MEFNVVLFVFREMFNGGKSGSGRSDEQKRNLNRPRTEDKTISGIYIFQTSCHIFKKSWAVLGKQVYNYAFPAVHIEIKKSS